MAEYDLHSDESEDLELLHQVPRGIIPNIENQYIATGPIGNMFQGVETIQIFNNGVSQKAEVSLSDECAEGFVEEFFGACRDLLEKEIEERITHRFEQLRKPEQRVRPKMVVTNFFRGNTAGAENLKADPTYLTSNSRKIKGDTIGMEEIHENCNYAAIIADAGAGKTTLSRRYSQAVDAKRIPELGNIEFVHFVSLAKLFAGEKGTFMELLFFRLLRKMISDKAKEYGSLWIKKNGGKILIVLDGLDQVDWHIKKCPKVSFEIKAHIWEVLYNLLHQDLLPGCKILLLSREFAIRHLDQDTRPEKIIALDGLSEKDIKILIKELAPHNSEKIIEHIFKKSPALRSLCTNPMFLIFTTAILAKDSDDVPESLSGVLMRLLFYFISSENQRVENIREILEKLCALAFEGMEKRSVAFTEDDMERHGLDAKLAQDLVIITPEEGTENHYKLMEGSFRLFFCHQSVQEGLAAVDVAKKPDNEFKTFVWTQLHQEHWEVVLRILIGIIFDSKTCKDAKKLTKGSIRGDTKKQIMTEWLVKVIVRNQTEDNRKQAKRMKLESGVPNFRTEDLCVLLYECGDGVHEIIHKNIHNLVIKKRIRVDQMHAVSWVMSHCHPGIEVELESGTAASSHDHLVKGLRNCKTAKVKLSNLSLCINNQLPIQQGIFKNSIEKITLNVKQTDTEPFKLLGDVLDCAVAEKVEIFPEKLKENALVTKEQLSEMKKITNGKISKLNICRKDLAAMSNTSSSIFNSIGELAKQFQVKDLFFKNLLLNEAEKCELEKGSENHKVEIRFGRAEE